MKNYKIIALIGKAGSGKDTLLNKIVEKNKELNRIISFTTRQKRDNEKEDLDYHFINVENFKNKIKNNEILEFSNFNGWYYGTSYDCLSIDKTNIGIFNRDGIESLKQKENIELIVFYIEAEDKIRMLRQLNREDNPDIFNSTLIIKSCKVSIFFQFSRIIVN